MRGLHAWLAVVLGAATASLHACTPRDLGLDRRASLGLVDDSGMDVEYDALEGPGSDAQIDAPEDADAGPGSDGMVELDDAPIDGPGSDAGGEAGVDGGGPGSDAGGEAGVDGGGFGSDAGGEAGVDGGGPGSDAGGSDAGVDGGGVGSDAGGSDAGGEAGVDGGGSDASGSDAGGEAGVDGGVGSDAGVGFDAGTDAMADAGVPDAMTDAAVPVVAVEVTPSPVNFGEVRIHTPEPSLAVTVTNLASSSVSTQITGVALRIGMPELQLTTPNLPFVLAPGESAVATLKLETLTELDLAGEYVDVTFTTGVTSAPVLGKVVTPSSRVAPSPLDLGTACVGTTVTGSTMLINDGTATLSVAAPQIDPSFVTSSLGTPTTLAPMGSLTATVSPASTAAGVLSATLLWHDDVPTDHMIPVTLEYVESGTAVSPRGLDWGTVPVEAPGISQLVQLQNCDPVPATIKIESLRTKQGPLAAWHVDPQVGSTRQLTMHEVQQTYVTFDPPGRGRYEAELVVSTPDGRKIIPLYGESIGRDFDRTSFYACMCSGGGPITHSWPIVGALVFVIRRRRRGN